MKRAYSPNFLFLCFFLATLNSMAQFEQKLTINGSAAFVYPDMMEEYSSFGSGFGLDGGLQFNKSRNLSFYGTARFYYLFGSATYSEAYYDNLSFGGGIKLNILPNKKINPYLYAEANINFIWFEEFIYSSGEFDSDFGTSIGALAGAGLDFMLNDNFAIYVQTAPYYTYWEGRINLYSQLGVRINLIKSKTL